MHYIVLDLEWNQPNRKEDLVTTPVRLHGEIIEIGAVKLNDAFETVDTFTCRVKPLHYTVMNYKVRALTGIRTADIKHQRPFPEAFEDLLAFCGEDCVLLTWGWDDLPMLQDNLVLHGLPVFRLPRVYNLQPIFASQITKENRQYSLSAAMECLGEPPFQAHNALSDALSTAAVCRHLDMETGLSDYADLTRSPKLPKIGRTFPSVKAALRDTEVNTLVCPECRKMIPCREWVPIRRLRFMALLSCPCGGDYKAYLYLIPNKDHTYRLFRRLFPLEEKDVAYYLAKKEKKEQRNKKKSPALSAH